MRSWFVIVLALVACNDHGAQALTDIKREVCDCKTVSCAEQALTRVPAKHIDSNHRTQTIAREMMDCLAKLQAAERPETDPDAEETTTAPSDPAPTATPAAASRP